MKFCTVLHTLNSPQNVGMILRSHVAHNGGEVIFTGHELPWSFKKGSQAFSRKLEKTIKLIHMPSPDEVIVYLKNNGFKIIALEINAKSQLLNQFSFPAKVALVCGNEGQGLPQVFLDGCDSIVTIPQYGRVASLNVAVSASIAMYELMRYQQVREVRGDEFI